jgi:urease accessory protein
MNKLKIILPILAILTTIFPIMTHAHTGKHSTDLFYGILHPVSGLDHILGIIIVGLIAYIIGGKSKYLMPLTFVISMSIGFILGAKGIQFSLLEQGILASNLILGAILLLAIKLPTAINYSMISLFALFHGLAHGIELPSTVSGISFGLGFILTTIGLIAVGLTTGYLVQNNHYKSQKLIYRLVGIFALSASAYLLYI